MKQEQETLLPLSPDFRCGYAAIVGEPNVGKSTLMNGLLGQKISIVTSKPQTTRHKILGILSNETFQAIFLDTPGIIEPRYALHTAMMGAADGALKEADIVMFMVDAGRPGVDRDSVERRTLERLREAGRPVYLLVNKIDLLDKALLLPLIGRYAEFFPFREIIPISAKTRDGFPDIQQTLARDLPRHPPLYPTDIVSDQQERFFVAEIIREKIFLECAEEVPYATSVDVVEFKEHEGKKWFISAEIYVERDSQKGILIGKQGGMLRTIGARSRKDIEKFLDHPVFLDLHVKVRGKWREDLQWLRRLGYTP
jgi:GTP-binding protein Era